MAHHMLPIAALIALSILAIATATSYTTTIITTFNEAHEIEHQQQQRCRQQVQSQGRARLQSCERYLSRSRFGREDENPFEEQEQGLRQCCEELRNFEEQCQCEAIKQVAQRAQQQIRGRDFRGRGESEEVYEKARELPRRCNLRMEQCTFRILFV